MLRVRFRASFKTATPSNRLIEGGSPNQPNGRAGMT
jgi:hypothetical protein